MSPSYTVPRNAAVALMIYVAGYFMVGMTAGAMLVLEPDYHRELREMIGWSAAILLFGQILCWRCGWEVYRRLPKAGVSVFVRVVLFAPITLWQKSGTTAPPPGEG